MKRAVVSTPPGVEAVEAGLQGKFELIIGEQLKAVFDYRGLPRCHGVLHKVTPPSSIFWNICATLMRCILIPKNTAHEPSIFSPHCQQVLACRFPPGKVDGYAQPEIDRRSAVASPSDPTIVTK
ncbi:hypothetical protein [Granulicella pectinivorans]|uniref:hypothetical protein n=1 Tax=Granulicella pectinivorans TaxID=474950 RepID=UPI001587308E|nr:hypothetical protein [Granulicella pectinivorans]